MNLFRYQVDAVKQLNEIIAYSLEKYELAKKRNREETSTVHFTSTTGSGKTLMSFVLMDEISKEFDNIVFIWIAPNKLHEQTLEKFESYSNLIYSKLKLSIFSISVLNSNFIKLFLEYEFFISLNSPNFKKFAETTSSFKEFISWTD